MNNQMSTLSIVQMNCQIDEIRAAEASYSIQFQLNFPPFICVFTWDLSKKKKQKDRNSS